MGNLFSKSENRTHTVRARLPWGAVVTLAAAILYSLTLSRHYTADSLLYAVTIEREELRALVDPAHILLHPLGLLWFRLWQAAGWSGRSLIPLQMLNALAGAACVGLMWALAKALGASQRVAGLVALGFALSGGLWLLSVEAEFVTIPLALQLSALWLILGIAALHMRRPLYALLLGLIVALAIFSYLTSFALLLVALVGLATAEMPLRIRWRQISLLGFTVLLLVGPALALILDLWSGGDWSNLAALGGQGLYGQLHWFNVAHGLYAFLRSFGLYPGLAMNDSTRELLAGAASWQRVVFFTYYLLLALLAAFPLLYLLRRRHAVWQAERRVISVLAAWIIPFAIFAFIWVPGDLSFWAPVLAGWWLVIALCFTHGAAERWLPTTVTAVLILGLLNATMVILPRRNLRTNLPYQTAQQVAAKTNVADLVLTGPQEMTALSLIYFANRQAWPVELVEPIGSDLPPAIAAQAQAVRRAGGQLYYLDAHGALRPID